MVSSSVRRLRRLINTSSSIQDRIGLDESDAVSEVTDSVVYDDGDDKNEDVEEQEDTEDVLSRAFVVLQGSPGDDRSADKSTSTNGCALVPLTSKAFTIDSTHWASYTTSTQSCEDMEEDHRSATDAFVAKVRSNETTNENLESLARATREESLARGWREEITAGKSSLRTTSQPPPSVFRTLGAADDIHEETGEEEDDDEEAQPPTSVFQTFGATPNPFLDDSEVDMHEETGEEEEEAQPPPSVFQTFGAAPNPFPIGSTPKAFTIDTMPNMLPLAAAPTTPTQSWEDREDHRAAMDSFVAKVRSNETNENWESLARARREESLARGWREEDTGQSSQRNTTQPPPSVFQTFGGVTPNPFLDDSEVDMHEETEGEEEELDNIDFEFNYSPSNARPNPFRTLSSDIFGETEEEEGEDHSHESRKVTIAFNRVKHHQLLSHVRVLCLQRRCQFLAALVILAGIISGVVAMTNKNVEASPEVVNIQNNEDAQQQGDPNRLNHHHHHHVNNVLEGSSATAFGCANIAKPWRALDGTTHKYWCDRTGMHNFTTGIVFSRPVDDERLSIPKGIRVYTANSCKNCDPLYYILEGSMNATTNQQWIASTTDQWIEIDKGEFPFILEGLSRNPQGLPINSTHKNADPNLFSTEVHFNSHKTTYLEYKLTFEPRAHSNNTHQNVQLAEIEIPGVIIPV